MKSSPRERSVVSIKVRRCLICCAKLKRQAASTSEIGRFETDLLASDENLNALTELSGGWIDKASEHTKMRELILDMDSFESPTYGQNEKPSRLELRLKFLKMNGLTGKSGKTDAGEGRKGFPGLKLDDKPLEMHTWKHYDASIIRQGCVPSGSEWEIPV